VEKSHQKVAYLWQLGVFFLSSPVCQNSPELYFHFKNSFIQQSLVGSLARTRSHIIEEQQGGQRLTALSQVQNIKLLYWSQDSQALYKD
jgi:hypothetical protein